LKKIDKRKGKGGGKITTNLTGRQANLTRNGREKRTESSKKKN